MIKEPKLKKLKKNLGNTYGYRNPAMAKAPTPAEKIIATEIEKHGLTIVTLNSKQCKWPTGYNEYGEITFCGEARYKGKDSDVKSPYCLTHHRLGLERYRPRRRDGVNGNSKESGIRTTGKSS